MEIHFGPSEPDSFGYKRYSQQWSTLLLSVIYFLHVSAPLSALQITAQRSV